MWFVSVGIHDYRGCCCRIAFAAAAAPFCPFYLWQIFITDKGEDVEP
jgi:hypothetical protein